MTAPVKYKLKDALTVGSETIEELEVQPPLLKHLRKTDTAKGNMERTALLISELCAIPPSTADMLSARDAVALGSIIESFLS